MSPQPLGQNFLASQAWRERIARATLDLPTFGTKPPKGIWIEIGAGHGEMTTLLAPHVERITAIELDEKLLPALQQATAAFPNVCIVPADVLSLCISELAQGCRFSVYGNLPYYITSPIIHRLFEPPDLLDAAYIVIQREVAERVVAKPHSRDYGYLSAFVQFYSQPELLMRIPSGAFHPRPKVDSALLALRMPGERANLRITEEQAFLRFLKHSFAQKRKTLRNNLRPFVDLQRLEHAMQYAELKPTARAEELGLTEFARLFDLVR